MNSRQQTFPRTSAYFALGQRCIPSGSSVAVTIRWPEPGRLRILWQVVVFPHVGCFQHVVVFMCQCVFVLTFDVHWLLRLAIALQLCIPTCVTQQHMPGSECNHMCLVQASPSFVFLFLSLLSCSIVSTAWAHCVSRMYVPSVTRQSANLPRQGTIHTPHVW